MEKHDIFISYRREGGQTTALLLYETLSRAGYRVAYDIETLLAGEFVPKIMQTIERCKDVLVVLSPNALARCADPNDLVRREIAKALESKCRVIPILLNGFSFPPPGEMPEDIRGLAAQNGVAASMPHFNSTVEQIVKRLASKPRWYRRKGVWAALVLAAGLAAGGAALCCPRAAPVYPSSTRERQDLERVLSGVLRQGAAVNEARAASAELFAGARAALGGNRPAFDGQVFAFPGTLRPHIREMRKCVPSETFLDTLGDSPLPVALYADMSTRCQDKWLETQNALPAALKRLLDSPLSDSRKGEALSLMEECDALDAEDYALDIMDLLRGVSPDALLEFRQAAAALTAIPRLSRGEWLRDADRIGIERVSVGERREIAARRIAELGGTQLLESETKSRELEDVLVQSGASRETAGRITAKIERNGVAEASLGETELALAAARERLWLKHCPGDGDEDGLLWDKARLFLSKGMPEAALEALSILEGRRSEEYPPEAVRSFGALCRLAPDLPFADGCMVLRFEPPATSHAVFRPGDVAVAREGLPIVRFEDLLPTTPGTTYSIRRPMLDGSFDSLDVVTVPDQPRISWIPVGYPEGD